MCVCVCVYIHTYQYTQTYHTQAAAEIGGVRVDKSALRDLTKLLRNRAQTLKDDIRWRADVLAAGSESHMDDEVHCVYESESHMDDDFHMDDEVHCVYESDFHMDDEVHCVSRIVYSWILGVTWAHRYTYTYIVYIYIYIHRWCMNCVKNIFSQCEDFICVYVCMYVCM